MKTMYAYPSNDKVTTLDGGCVLKKSSVLKVSGRGAANPLWWKEEEGEWLLPGAMTSLQKSSNPAGTSSACIFTVNDTDQ